MKNIQRTPLIDSGLACPLAHTFFLHDIVVERMLWPCNAQHLPHVSSESLQPYFLYSAPTLVYRLFYVYQIRPEP
jgi:hypothetical protein